MRANRRLLASLTVLLLGLAALAESIRLGHGGLAAVLGLLVVATTPLLLERRGRAPVALRPDLARWVAHTTAATGEPPERLVDRAVSTYRAQLDRGTVAGAEGRERREEVPEDA